MRDSIVVVSVRVVVIFMELLAAILGEVAGFWATRYDVQVGNCNGETQVVNRRGGRSIET